MNLADAKTPCPGWPRPEIVQVAVTNLVEAIRRLSSAGMVVDTWPYQRVAGAKILGLCRGALKLFW